MVCARPVSESVRAVSAPFVFDPASPIDADLACRNCGYNLRGLTLGALCPECGRPVLNSARGDQLRYCDPAWVRTLSRGSRLVLTGYQLFVLAFLAGTLANFLARGGRNSATGEEHGEQLIVAGIAFVISMLAWLSGWIVAFIGMWFITAREPAANETGSESRARSIVRYGLLSTLFSLLLNFFVAGVPGLSATFQIAALIIVVLIQLFGIYAAFGYFRWVSKLAERLADPTLARWAMRLSYWVPGTMFFPTVLTGAIIFMAKTGVGAPGARSGGSFEAVFGMLMCPTCCSLVLAIFVFISAIRLQSKLGVGLRYAAADAELNAKGDGAVPEARAVAE